MATLDIKKIQAPDLTQSQYGANLRQQFENIDDNFRKISNHDFIKGDTGTSIYTKTIPLTTMSGDDDNKTVLFTEQGLEVVASILQNIIDQQGESVDAHDILPSGDEVTTTEVATSINDAQLTYPKLICLKSVNGVSLVDYFYDATSSNSVVEMTGIYSYDPVIGVDSELLVGITNNVVFRDERFVKITTNLTEDDLAIYSDLIDTSCTVYGIVKNGVISYNVLQNFPTLYYNAESGIKSFCWNFAGSKTGIIASGPQGVPGMSGTMYMCISETPYTTSQTAYEISRFHDPDNTSASDYYNTKAETSNLPAGTNVVVFLDYVTESDKESRTFISTIYHEGGVVKAYCSSSNCIQSNINITEFKSILDTINSQNADLAGLYIPYLPNNTDNKYVHMLYGTKVNTYFDTLHIGATRYDKLGTMPSDEDSKYLDALQIDYKTTLINGRLGVGDLSEGNSNHTAHKFHVNGSSLFDGEVHIQGNGDVCQTDKSNKYAHLFVGGRSGFTATGGTWGLQPGYVYIQSSSDNSGRLYVDKIYPYSVTKDNLSYFLDIYGGWSQGSSSCVKVGDYEFPSDLKIMGNMQSDTISCLGQMVIKGVTNISNRLVVSKLVSLNNGVYVNGNMKLDGSLLFSPSTIISSSQKTEQNGRIQIHNRFVTQADLTSSTGFQHIQKSYDADNNNNEYVGWSNFTYGNNDWDDHKWAVASWGLHNDMTGYTGIIRKITTKETQLNLILECISNVTSTLKTYRTVEVQVWLKTSTNVGNTSDTLEEKLLKTYCYTYPSQQRKNYSVPITIPSNTHYTNINLNKSDAFNLSWDLYVKVRIMQMSSKNSSSWGYVIIRNDQDIDNILIPMTFDIDVAVSQQYNAGIFLDAFVLKNSNNQWMMLQFAPPKNETSNVCTPYLTWKADDSEYGTWNPVNGVKAIKDFPGVIRSDTYVVSSTSTYANGEKSWDNINIPINMVDELVIQKTVSSL